MIGPMVSQRYFWPFAVGILAVSLLLYWPSPKMGFVLDDHYVIAQNPVIKNPALYSKIFTGGFFAAAHRTPESRLNYYRPVLTASLAVDYRLWGANAFGYRIVNIFLHAINGILVFVMLVLLFRNPGLASLAALFFCILPTHEWVVRYIVGRGDLLQTLFSLLCFISFIVHLTNARRAWWYGSLICFVLALLSREVAVLNIVFLFLIGYYSTRDLKRTLWAIIPFFILAAGYYGLRVEMFPIAEGNLLTGAGQGLITASGYIVHWLSPALVLAVSPFSLLIAAFFAVAAAVYLLTTLGPRKDQDQAALVGFGVLWIAAGVVPFAVTYRITERLGPVLSEHFLYFASIGFALLLAFLLEKMRTPPARKILFVGVATYFLSVGLINGLFWSNEETLLRHVQSMEGKEFTVAYEQIAMRFDDDERLVRRLADHASSRSNRSLWLKRLGNIYHKRGDNGQAIAALENAVALNPSNIEAINELGVVYLEKGDKARGFALLAQSLKVDPDAADTYRLLGVALYAQGDFAGAVHVLQRAMLLDPDQMENPLYLMASYFLLNDNAAYLALMEKTTERFSDDRAILRFMAFQLSAHGHFAETVKILNPTRQLFAADPQTLALLADAQRRLASLPK